MHDAQEAPDAAQKIGANAMLLQLMRNISAPLRVMRKIARATPLRCCLSFLKPIKRIETTAAISAISDGIPRVAAM